MKKLTLILSLFCASALGADGVVINDNGTVTRDNVCLNNAGDALLNKAVTAKEFNEALLAKLAAVNAAAAKAQADLAALRAQMQAQLNGDLTALQTALQAAADDTQKAVIEGKLALVQDYIAAAFKSPDQLRAETLASEIAAKQAELAKLQTP